MTVDIYGHLIPSSNREMVNRLDSPQSTTRLKTKDVTFSDYAFFISSGAEGNNLIPIQKNIARAANKPANQAW